MIDLETLKLLFSPVFLVPALLGYVFYALTKDAKQITGDIKYAKRHGKEHWYDYMSEPRPIWTKEPGNSHLLFLVPGYNILFLVVSLWIFIRDGRLTKAYLTAKQRSQRPRQPEPTAQ